MAVNLLPASSSSSRGGHSGLSEDDKLRQMYIALLTKGASNTSPIQSHWQGADRLAQAALAGILMRQQADQERNNTAAMGSLTFGGPAAAPQAASPMGGFFSGLGNMFGGGSSPATAPDIGGPNLGAPIMAPTPPPQPAMTKGSGIPQEALSPVQLDQQKPAMQGGQLPVGIDRSRFSQELNDNPALVNKMAAMVRGEVGLGRNKDQETIQLESAFNRAQARNIPLAQALLAVNEDPKRGYYARDTYRPIDEKSIKYFKDNILPAVMGGSDASTKFLGSPVTGNGSQLDFAGRRAAQGMYDNYKWYSGVPGKGEMFVTEKGDANRFARNVPRGPIVPPVLMTPQPMGPAAEMAPAQVASADPNFVPRPDAPVIPPPMQQMAQAGGFQPGQLPNVPNVAVRPAGIPQPLAGGAPPVGPQAAQPVPAATPNTPQQFGPVPQVDNRAAIQQKFDQVKTLYQQAVRAGNTTLAKQLIDVGSGLQQQLLKPPEQSWEALGDKALIDKKTGRVIPYEVGKNTTGMSDLQDALKNWQTWHLPDPKSNNPVDQKYWRDLASKAYGGVGGTTVNVGPTGIDYGAPPKDMAWARDQGGNIQLEPDPVRKNAYRPIAVPVAGGSVEIDAQEKAKKEKEQKTQQGRYGDVVTTDVDRALDLVKNSQIPVTGMGSLLSAVPGSPAHNVANLVNTVKANIGFDRLQQMRASSPTGGALGNVSDTENKMLQATLGALEQSQSEDQFRYNLQRVKDMYLDIIHGPGNRPAARSVFEQGAEPLQFGGGGVPSLQSGAMPQAQQGGWQDLGGGVRIREKP